MEADSVQRYCFVTLLANMVTVAAVSRELTAVFPKGREVESLSHCSFMVPVALGLIGVRHARTDEEGNADIDARVQRTQLLRKVM